MDYEKEYKDALARMELCVRTGLKITPEYIFPELAESEDERIRKWIIGYAKGQIDGFSLVDDEECNKIANQWRKAITYLEKQKEPENVSATTMAPSCWAEEPSLQKEQKPVEPSGKLSREEYLYQLLIDQLITYSDYEYLTGKKPAEIATNQFDGITYGMQGHSIEKSAERFEEAREKYQVEWSEEDEKIIDTIVSVLGQYIDYKAVSGTGSGYATPRYAKEIAWLKSLRPSWMPSEQEKGALRTAIHILTDERSFPKAAAQLQNILDAFEGKESRKDWKPSKDEERLINTSISFLKDFADKGYENAVECIDFLKSKLNGNSGK